MRAIRLVRTVAVLAVALVVGAAIPTAAAQQSHPLTLAARAWGLAKYFHPGVTSCAVDWDQALMDALPALEAAGTDVEARSQALMALLDAAGAHGAEEPTAGTPQWIRDAAVTAPLRARLAWLAAQQPHQQCYVQRTLAADFSTDAGHAIAAPDRAHRALAAFRFWNAIEYFFPYKADIGRDWAGILDQTLDPVLDAPDFGAYVRAMRVLTAAIEDTHAGFGHPPVAGLASAGPPPFLARLVEGRPVVVQVRAEAGAVRPGDEVLAVDGEAIADRMQGWDAMGYGSNPLLRQHINLRRALSGLESAGTYGLRRPDGSEYEATLPRSGAFQFPSASGITGTFEARNLPGGCRMGIIDMARLEPTDVPATLDALADTDAIVFDVRNYPLNTLWPITARLYPEPRAVALFDQPDLLAPGTFERVSAPIGGNAHAPYSGRILVLFDERSISHSEYTVMGLQAIGNALTFGSQTAAADGNVTTIELPGGLRAVFTGLGVYYPDGTPTQRVGIVPDVHVTPSIAGIAAGRDEVLDAALDCNWIAADPAPRMPRTGLYMDMERSGEGLDVHRDQHLLGALSYGYDAAGEPTWLLAGAGSSDGDWGRQFLAYSRPGTELSSTPADDFRADFHRGPYEIACASADQSTLHPRGSWYTPGGDAGGRCLQPLLLTASPGTGLWAGPPEDLGWGLSVHHVGDLLAVYLYGYDNSGAPRWLLGQADWDGQAPVEIALLRARGFCRSCPPVPVQFTPAGSVRLELDPDRPGHGWLDADVRFGDGPAWVRTRTPLQRVVDSQL